MSREKKLYIVIDPPEGWRHGFPKAYTAEEFKKLDLEEEMMAHGYEGNEVQMAVKYLRTWTDWR